MKFHSVKTQLIVVYAMLIVLIVGGISFTTGMISSNALTKNFVVSANRELTLMNEKLNLFITSIEMESLYLTQMQGDAASKDPYQQFLYTSGILSFLQDFIYTQPSVDSIAFYDTSGNVFFSDAVSSSSSVKKEAADYIIKFRENNVRSEWVGFHDADNSSVSSDSKWICSFLRKLYSYSGEFTGILELNIDEAAIQTMYASSIADSYNFYILDDSQQVVSAADKSLIRMSRANLESLYPPYSGSLLHASSEFLYTTYTNDTLGWTLVSTLPLKVVLNESRTLIISICLTGFTAFLLSFILLNSITYFVTRPLRSLTHTVDKISQGDYTIRADTSSSNEIGRLAQSINHMSENTLHLLDEIKKEETLKRQFEFSYIQLQMSPHFLYNTLETICGMIAVDEKKKAIKTIQSLSSFYKKVLSKGLPIITIEQELEIIRCYLDILQERYREIFTYEILSDPEAVHYKLPKLTLQPIVENALIHGILPTGKQGKLRIEVFYKKEQILLSVTDTGKGIDADTLSQIRNLIKSRNFSSEADTGFGIVSTLQRLHLFLQDSRADMQIDSTPSEGTQILLILPAQNNFFKEEFSPHDV